jgi:uncharacterized membrane protein
MPEHWRLTLTAKEAAAAGIPKREYMSAALYARIAVEEHQRLGTPRRLWEPLPNPNHILAAPFITGGEQELVRRLSKEADPALARAQGLIENVQRNLAKVAEDTQPITSPESGSTYSPVEAADLVGQYDKKIYKDAAHGRYHHTRVPRPLRWLATWAPWIEAAGFLTFVTYYLNVPVLQPWQDWLDWSFVADVIIAIILGQTWLVRRAARSHNHAREARADGHRHEAAWAFRRRNWHLALIAVTAIAITTGMIWRGFAALGNASIGTTAVLLFAAVVTGLLLPTLAYLGIALDGSRVSRERDGLAADLDDRLGTHLKSIGISRRNLVIVAAIGDTLRKRTFPNICHAAQEAVDGVYQSYSTVRLLIGGLSTDAPYRTAETISVDSAGDISGYIGTSIPGTGTVSLSPLVARQRRLAEIESKRADLLEQIDALPPLPPTPAGSVTRDTTL